VGGLIKVPCVENVTGPAGETTVGGLLTIILEIALAIIGSVSVVFLVLGGYRYVTSRGNEEATEGAKKTITNAILGVIIVIMAFAIVAIISRVLLTGQVRSP
ncbi:hypothetical protein D4S03_11115, partial [bacterium]